MGHGSWMVMVYLSIFFNAEEQLFKKLFSFCKVSSFVLVGYPEVLGGESRWLPSKAGGVLPKMLLR